MNLDDVHRGIAKRKPRRRVGRGTGSGHGKTSGRGHKGQKSRAGWSRSPVFQGGAMPLVRRIPKRGFNNQWARIVATVNVRDLEEGFSGQEEVNPDSLRAKSLVSGKFDEVKILGDGELSTALTVAAHRFSKSAGEKIKAAGGQDVILALSKKQAKEVEEAGGQARHTPGKTPVAEKKQA